jgi:geranylgeranyl diphosphate synthase type I
MAAGKTGALLGCASAIGAVLAGAPVETIAALQTYGEELGLAFQLIDDLLGIWGDSAITGKPVGSDLRARKKSLPITFAIGSGTSAGDELAAWLASSGDDTDEQVGHAADLVAAGGGRDWARAEAERRLQVGAQALAGVDLDDRVRDELIELGRFIVVRDA